MPRLHVPVRIISQLTKFQHALMVANAIMRNSSMLIDIGVNKVGIMGEEGGVPGMTKGMTMLMRYLSLFDRISP